MNIDIKGFTLGLSSALFMMACLVVTFLLVALMYLESVGHTYPYHASTLPPQSLQFVFFIIFIAVSNCVAFISGLVTAKVCDSSEILTAILVGFSVACLSLIPLVGKNQFYAFLWAAPLIPSSYFGAMAYLRRASKSAHCRSLSAGNGADRLLGSSDY